MSAGGDSSVRKSVEIVNRLGLHARAATRFVQVAAEYAADVAVIKDGERVDGKSVISLLMLAAGQGAMIEIEADGEDAGAAIDALAALIANRFDEPT